jgi:hypothetical protein
MQREGRSNRSVVILVGLAAALLWLLWPAGEEPGTVAAAPAPVAAPAAGPAEQAERPAAAVLATRDDLTEPAPPEPQPEPILEHPFAYRLDLRLVDAFGLPVPGAMAFAAPPLCGFSLWPQLSDGRGIVRLRWRGRLTRMQLQVVVLVWGVLQPIRVFDLDAERTHSPVMVVRGREQSEEVLERLRQRTPGAVQEDAMKVRRGRLRRNDELDVVCGRTLLLFRDFDCTSCHEQSRISHYATLARCGVMVPSLHPSAMFADLRQGSLNDEQRRERQHLLDQSEQAPEARAEGPAAHAFVRGTVREASGRPAVQVPVAWLGDDGALRKRTLTGADGRYRLGPVAAGFLTLCAGGGDGGDARVGIVVNDGDDTPCDFHLTRTSVVTGSAHDENGGVLADWRVEYENYQGDWADLAQTHKDGTFAIPSVPGLGQLLLWPGDADLRLPVQYGRAAIPEGAAVAFWLDPAMPTRARLRLRTPSAARAEVLPAVDARLFQLDTARAAMLPALGWDNLFELGGLPAGPYRIEVGAPLCGWIDCGVRHVDGRGLWDMGNVSLPVPGRVRLRTPGGLSSPLASEHACYRRTEAVDILEQGLERDNVLTLPPGEHLLLWRPNGRLQALAFRVVEGGLTDVYVPLR